MSADLIRRAAKVLRDHADAAARGSWTAAELGYPQGVWSAERPFDQHPDGWFISTTLAEKPNEDACYIALMHPPVALALADWLEAEAETVERHHAAWSRSFDVVQRYGGADAHVANMFAKPIAVARAILREEADHG